MSRPSFSRGHYIKLAGALRSGGINLDALCTLFSKDNPKFNPETFRRACGEVDR